MAKWKESIPEDAAAEQPKKRKKKHPLLRLLPVILLVLVAVAAVLFLRSEGFDRLRRDWFYQQIETDESGVAQLLSFDANTENRYAMVGESLLVVSDSRVTLVDKKGKQLYAEGSSLEQPTLTAAGGQAVVYSVGDTQLQLFNEKGFVRTMSGFNGLISVRLSESGHLTVVDSKGGYKGNVSVYNGKGEKVFDYHSSSRYIISARVMGNGRHVAVVTLGQEESVFLSNILYFNLSTAEQVASSPVTDGLVLDLYGEGDSLTLVTDSSLAFAGLSGGAAESASYSGWYLREYSLGGDGFAALVLGRYQSGSLGSLSTYDRNGQLLGSLDIRDEVQSISACGAYLAVLYSNRLVIYNPDLSEYSVLTDTDYARTVLMREDGSALLLSASAGWIYLP